MRPVNSIYSFEDPVDFFRYELREQRRLDDKFSVREWSRRLGYKNPSYLSHVLNGKRRLKPDLAGRIADNLKLEGTARRYLDVLVLHKNASTELELETYAHMLQKLRPPASRIPQNLSLELSAFGEEWYHRPILEIARMRKVIRPADCVRALKGRVTLKKTRDAFARLERLGFLKQNASQEYQWVNGPEWLLTAAMPAETEVRANRQWATLGLNALDAKSPSGHTFRGCTISLSKERLQEAQELLSGVIQKLNSMGKQENGNGASVYHLNLQLLRLTDN